MASMKNTLINAVQKRIEEETKIHKGQETDRNGHLFSAFCVQIM